MDYIHIFICLLTSVVYIIIGLAAGEASGDILLKLIFVIIISYAVGSVLRAYLKKSVFPPESFDSENQSFEAELEAQLHGAPEDASEETAGIAGDDDAETDDFFSDDLFKL